MCVAQGLLKIALPLLERECWSNDRANDGETSRKQGYVGAATGARVACLVAPAKQPGRGRIPTKQHGLARELDKTVRDNTSKRMEKCRVISKLLDFGLPRVSVSQL